jgi:hypothetical protein
LTLLHPRVSKTLLTILSLDPLIQYAFLLQPQLANGSRVTLGGSFLSDNSPNIETLKENFKPLIDKMEEEYHDMFIGDTRVKFRALPPKDTQPSLAPQQEPKTSKTPSIQARTLDAVQQLSTNIDKLVNNMTATQTAPPSPFANIDWTPIVQAGVQVAAKAFGVQVQVGAPAPSDPTPTPMTQAGALPAQTQPSLDEVQVPPQIKSLEARIPLINKTKSLKL